MDQKPKSLLSPPPSLYRVLPYSKGGTLGCSERIMEDPRQLLIGTDNPTFCPYSSGGKSFL
jgi:hypothetical protein